MLAILTVAPAAAQVDAPAPAVTAQAGSPDVLVGAWEGEAQTERWPLFLTLELEQAERGIDGRLLVLGNRIELDSVISRPDGFTITSGSGPQALILEGAVENGFLVGRLRQGGATRPFRLRRIPIYPTPANRVEAWRQDLDALEHRFLPADRSFSPAERSLFLERLATLRSQLPALSDAEVVMGIASAIALADNAHSRLYILRNRTELRRLPIRLWWFDDGLRVVRAAADHRQLLGCRVDAIAGLDPRQARDLVAPAFAGNPSWTDYKSVYSLTSPEALHGMGVTTSLDQIAFTFDDCIAAGVTAIAPLPLLRSRDPVEAWWDLAPGHASHGAGWVQVLSAAGQAPPLYLRVPNRYYRFEYLHDSGILYLQFNRAAQMESESLDRFEQRVTAAFAEHPVRALVVDLRFNTGGNLGLASGLMERLEERTRSMPRFVITGRATFSAGITHAAAWRQSGSVTIVGEPVGDALDFWSEGGNIILPNSELAAHFANGAHSYSTAPCPQGTLCLDMNSPSLRPDLPASLGWADYISGRDPAMEAIVRALDARPRS